MIAICEAIRGRLLLEFDYHGKHRVVAPYCHGTNAREVAVLRGVQVRGGSASGGFGFGKLWLVPDMSVVRVTSEAFEPNDPDYNPNDSAIARIHCRV